MIMQKGDRGIICNKYQMNYIGSQQIAICTRGGDFVGVQKETASYQIKGKQEEKER